MSNQSNYPGVNLQEETDGIKTIEGVSTSITAFIGRALRGPVNDPVEIHNFGDFQTIFGGLWNESTMSYTVQDFFLNGGTVAIIVRLFNPVARDGNAVPFLVNKEAIAKAQDKDETFQNKGAAVSTLSFANKAQTVINDFILEAADEGAWGNDLRVRIEQSEEQKTDDLFDLRIRDGITGYIEVFKDVSVKEDALKRVDTILEKESGLMCVYGPLTLVTPHANLSVNEGDDPWDDFHSVPVAIEGSDGYALTNTDYIGNEAEQTGIFALGKSDIFNLLCIPPFSPVEDVSSDVWAMAAGYCELRRAMLIIDAPAVWANTEHVKYAASIGFENIPGTVSQNAALFFPRITKPNKNGTDQTVTFPPCGFVAGIIARTDMQRGIWKAPAGATATLIGAEGLDVLITDRDAGDLNRLGINTIRAMPSAGIVLWGARTLQGNDRFGSEWKYIPVRRLALFIEESLIRGLKWVVFEPNGEPLWLQIRMSVSSFLHQLYMQGAFQGRTPGEAYFVKCDKETTSQQDIELGIINLIVGMAPLRPREFVILHMQLKAGIINS